MDEKFLGVPNFLFRRGVAPFIGVTFAADDGHQHISMREYLGACLRLRRTSAFNGIPARLLDRDLSFGSMLRGFRAGIAASVRQLSAERSKSFREAWSMDGVDIYPLLHREMRMAAYRTPRYLMHMIRMRSFLNRVQPDAVVSSLFEFCYGRATSYAIATSNARPLNIGAQHGPTGRKLMYRFAEGELALGTPMPDSLLLEGEEARIALSESGYPDDRLHVRGAPRLDRLADVPRWSGSRSDVSGPVRVLVAFGGSDGAQIMSLCKPVVSKAPGYHFIMKPHPRSPIQPPDIDRALSGANASTYETAMGSVYEILPTVDVVIATYSSVGQETAALGYPTIVLNLPDFASPSGLLDVSGNVRFAASPAELVAALADSANATTDGADVVERTFFWKLDGHAQERWADTIADLVKSRAFTGS